MCVYVCNGYYYVIIMNAYTLCEHACKRVAFASPAIARSPLIQLGGLKQCE